MPMSMMMPTNPKKIQLHMERHQCSQCAERRRRQSRKNRERVHETLIQNAQHDINDQDRHGQQQSEPGKRLLKRMRFNGNGRIRFGRADFVQFDGHRFFFGLGCHHRDDRRIGMRGDVLRATRS
jgi:hypothetical protein